MVPVGESGTVDVIEEADGYFDSREPGTHEKSEENNDFNLGKGGTRMDNGIGKRQNEEISIQKLAAQRQLYREAKRKQTLSAVFCVAVPFLLSAAEAVIGKSWALTVILALISVLSMYISYRTDKCISGKKQCAADIQQLFDVYVYQMPWSRALFGNKRNCDRDVAQKAGILLKDKAERNALLNWYEEEYSEMGLGEGIIGCQLSNANWDAGLRKRLKAACYFLTVILVLVILAMSIIMTETVIKCIIRMAFILPILTWLAKITGGLDSDLERLKRISRLIYSEEMKDMRYLQWIQSELYEHRKKCFLVPEWFYDLFRGNDEDTARNEARKKLQEELKSGTYDKISL